ncbi:hypothetical protein K4L06_19695 [Lysobacter sp. BMK333-48F3]|uniref:hypothetical protein n=1 Tax=Lysobacter sp. BMK333-48F3 TaxID=2867962 RepID=UPI001C8BA63A|nr:hypothetical protein [Lysobacter sp. BMK333-48F3]MBX9403541.1 hypothetical protein [Lysobacter sp. BMK333-48F3]
MPITSEVLAKIDALEDEGLKAKVIQALTGPGIRRASDEDIYELIVTDSVLAKQEQARLKQWKDDEVLAFIQYFKEKKPEDYAELLRQEKELNEIDTALTWDVRRLIWDWMPDLSSADCSGLFRKLRHHAKSFFD